MAKKMYVVAAVALLAVFVAFEAPSQAKVMEFDFFSLDVPDGWKVEEDKETVTVSIVAPDDSAAMTLAIIKNEGESLEKYASEFCSELNGKNLRKTDSGYLFTFMVAEVLEAQASVTGDDNLILFITLIGEHDDLLKMAGSLKGLI